MYTSSVNIHSGGHHGTGNVKMDKLIRCLIKCHSQILVYKGLEINDGSCFHDLRAELSVTYEANITSSICILFSENVLSDHLNVLVTLKMARRSARDR